MGIVSVLSGRVRAQVNIPRPERFLNFCAQENIALSCVYLGEDGTLQADMRPQDYKRVAEIAEEHGFNITAVRRHGPAAVIPAVKKRVVLLALPVLLLALVWVSGLFVWKIEILGVSGAAAAQVRSVLGRCGLSIGVCCTEISSEKIANDALQQLPGLSYLAVNVRGSTAVVTVREETPLPQTAAVRTPAAVYAAADGVIRRMVVLEGKAAVSVGDAVTKGQLLVPYTAGSISSGERTVRADARVYAETCRRLSACVPLQRWEKVYTGRQTAKYSLIIWGKRINLYFNSSNQWTFCDKITMENDAKLFGRILPITLVKESSAEYELLQQENCTAEAMLQDVLMQKLLRQLGEGEILSWEYEKSEAGGVLTVTLTAFCLEDIALQTESPQ